MKDNVETALTGENDCKQEKRKLDNSP